MRAVSTDLSGLDGYWWVKNIEVIDVGEYKIFGVRNIADMNKLIYGKQGNDGYTDGDRALAQDDNIEMVGYICRGENKWDRYGNAATYLPIMRSRFKYVTA